MTAVLVLLGGAVGAVLRFVVDGEIKHRRTTTWPLATFLINIVGSGVLGWAMAAHLGSATTAFVATGICGGFTTFSTASVETVTLLRSQHSRTALGYALGTLVACWLSCAVGAALGG